MKTALMVIDFINDIVAATGKIPSCAEMVSEHQVIAHANEAINYAKSHDHLVIYVKVGFSASYVEQPKQSPIFGKANQFKALCLGQWGCEFHQDLVFNPDDIVIIKHRVSPFYGTDLDVVLRTNKIERLVLSGVSTTWAIQATTRDAHDRDYAVCILKDACAAASVKEHESSLEQLARIASIVNVEDYICHKS